MIPYDYKCPNCGKFRSVDPACYEVGDIVMVGNPSLKPAKGWTWDKVVALLKATRRKAYLVTKMTPDKEAIRLHVKPHKLAKLGLEIRQEETFYVERATEQ